MAEILETAAPEQAVSSPSFADAYAEMMGDLQHTPDAEPDEPAGDSPAASPETPDAPTTDAEPAGEPPADAATPETPQPDTDPFEGATAAAYRVNGEERTFDGIQVLKDRSGVIDPDKMDLVLHRLSERDHLFETNLARQKELTDLQAQHAEVTRWKLDDGREVMGREGAQAKDLAYALTRAERDAYDQLLSDPTTVFGLLAQDANGNIIWNKPTVDLFLAQLQNKKLQLQTAVEKHYATRMSAPTTAQTATASTTIEPTVAAEALITSLGVKGFGPEDKAWVASLAEDMVRPATRDDVARDPANAVFGQPYAPPKLIGLIRDRAQLLERSAKQVQAAGTVDKENAARLAAAARGKKPAANAPIATKPAKTPTRDEQKADDYDTWYEKQQDAAAAVMRQSLAGR